LEVLEGASEMPSRTRYVVVEQGTKDVIEFLRRNDYRVELLRQSRYMLGTNINFPKSRRSAAWSSSSQD
jgi:hypothetical protein